MASLDFWGRNWYYRAKNLNMSHQNSSDPSEHLWRCHGPKTLAADTTIGPQLFGNHSNTNQTDLGCLVFLVSILWLICAHKHIWFCHDTLSPVFLLFSWCVCVGVVFLPSGTWAIHHTCHHSSSSALVEEPWSCTSSSLPDCSAS